VYPALVTDTIRSDTVFVPYHWPAPTAANILTIDALDPVSKIPEFKVCACRVDGADEVDPVPPPPNPPDHAPYRDVTGPLADRRPPTMSQGRETSR
jgi:assimilatory nitrate reductase catalytic subunit